MTQSLEGAGLNSQEVGVLVSNSDTLQLCYLDPAASFSESWFLYLSDENEKNLLNSVGKFVISS